MVDINEFLSRFQNELEKEFPKRIVFIGLQGSYGRGEAKTNSDIDVVVIFDELFNGDLILYRNILDRMPEKDLICGFVASVQELNGWLKSDLLSLILDTKSIKGKLDFKFSDSDVKEAVLTMACGLYHGISHNFLHERSLEMLIGCKKSIMFLLRLKYYMDKGEYIASMSKLISALDKSDREIAMISFQNFDISSLKIIDWASNIIKTIDNA